MSGAPLGWGWSSMVASNSLRWMEFADLFAQLAHALTACVSGSVSRLERNEVALDRILGLATLRRDRAEPIFARLAWR